MCKKLGFYHYHAPGKSKKVLALGMDKLDEDKIIRLSYPWDGSYYKEAPVRSHWVMTSKRKGGTYEFMDMEKIVKGFTKGDITFDDKRLKVKGLK